MNSTTKRTAGSQCLRAAADSAIYDPIELGYAISDDVVPNLFECAFRHESVFDEKEYFVVLLVCSDPLLYNLRRHKYYAYPAMPDPRPMQSAYLYSKNKQTLKRLWSLPNPALMAALSERFFVHASWRESKAWCDAFFLGKFHETIRKQHGIEHLSEREYLDVHREKFIKAGAKNLPSPLSKPVDAGEILIKQVVDSYETLSKQGFFEPARKAEDLNGNVHP